MFASRGGKSTKNSKMKLFALKLEKFQSLYTMYCMNLHRNRDSDSDTPVYGKIP
jgi:hypothetical protein